MRTRPRIDLTQTSIVGALRAAGYLVQTLAAVGGGVPDLLVGCPWGELVLVECKTQRGKRRLMTPLQVAWHQAWRRCPVCVGASAGEVLDWMNARRRVA